MNVKDQASVIVSKPPTSIHIEVDGVQKSSEVINFSESKSRKVKIVIESLLGLLVLFQMYTESHSSKLLSLTVKDWTGLDWTTFWFLVYYLYD